MTAASRPMDRSDPLSALRALGRRLQNARLQAGLTQRVVAGELEVTPQTIRNWEAGKNEPPHRLRRQLADLYGKTVPEIMGQDAAGHMWVLTPRSRLDVDPARLRLGRRRASLSQQEASEQSRISRSTLGRYERGSIKPTTENLEALATLYRRPFTWFVTQTPVQSAGPTGADPDMYDEVLEAYSIAQPDLPQEALKSIADYIRFLHDRELHEQR